MKLFSAFSAYLALYMLRGNKTNKNNSASLKKKKIIINSSLRKKGSYSVVKRILHQTDQLWGGGGDITGPQNVIWQYTRW